MATATFGRKGATNSIGQPGTRRATFGQAGAAAAPASTDAVADRRAAFLASERARAADADDGKNVPSGDMPKTMFIKERSLTTAYMLWFFLGSFSAHRFYLGTPLTAIAQVCLWYVSLMLFMAGHGFAFYTMGLGWLWIIGDVILIPQLRERANERARKRAEGLALEKIEPEPRPA